METKFRYGCIGAGGIARKKHLPGYMKLPDVKVVAVCDTFRSNAHALADSFGGLHVYTDYKKMIQEESLDIVSICTPNMTHAQIALDAMELGCHVHIEKPMALTAADAEKILECEKRTEKRVIVGLNKRYQAEAVLIDRLVSEGFFGEICHVKCGWERSSGIPGSGAWFTDVEKSGGGALIDLGVHYLDWALSMLGYPQPKSIAGTSRMWFLGGNDRIRRGYKSNPDGVCNVEDYASGSVQMDNGTLLDFSFSWASNIKEEVQYLEILGKDGGMRYQNGKLEFYCQKGGTMFTMTPDPATMPLPEDEFAHFVDCIRTGKPVKTGAEKSANALKIIEKIYEQIL